MDEQTPSELGNPQVNVRKALFTMWVIWTAMLLGPLGFMYVEATVLSKGDRPQADPQSVMNLIVVAVVMLLAVIPATFFIRSMIFKRQRVNGVLPAAAYSTGNLVFWAGCESVSFFALIVVLIKGSFWPTILIVGFAMLLQVLTYPKREYLESREESFKIQ